MLLNKKVDKNKINLLINNLAFGLGLTLLIIGIMILNQPIKEETEKVGGNLDTSSLSLNYNRLTTAIEGEVEITIPAGSSGITVANILDEKGIMPYAEFKKYLHLFNIENRIRAGKYKFNNQDTFADILNRILIKRK